MNQPVTPPIVEPPYFSNWADQIMPKIANRVLLPVASQIPGLTPNHVTVFSFLLYCLGCVFLFLSVPYHFIYTAILMIVAYIFDCLDGQLARTKKLSSVLGDYLDKTLDVLKIYVVTISMAIAAYGRTGDILYIFLGFTACFFFNYRYYIKLETMFSRISNDPEYLAKSRAKRYELWESLGDEYKKLSRTVSGRLQIFWRKNKSLFALDEAEFVVLTALGALIDHIEWTLWIMAVGQTVIAFWRLAERGYALAKNPEALLKPMRK